MKKRALLAPRHKSRNGRQAASWITVFGLIGALAVILIRASTGPIGFEPESGTLSGTAKKLAVGQASGGYGVVFGAATPSPTPAPLFGQAVLISPGKIAQLKAIVANQTQPNYASWLQVKSAADAALNHTPSATPNPWDISASVYSDQAAYDAAIAPLKQDSRDVYMLGLAYQVTGNATYATKAVGIIQAWSGMTFKSSYTTSSVLPWTTFFGSMVYGADLVRSSSAFTSADQTAFANMLVQTTKPSMTFLADNGTNNQGSWGVAYLASVAAYLKDQTLFDRMVARYKAIQDAQLDASSTPTQEIHRQGAGQGDGSSGLAYSNFAMMAMTYGAEVMKVQGVDVYSYTSPNGGNLHSMYNLVSGWTANPSTFPYSTTGVNNSVGYWDIPPYEILNARWPNANGQTVLSQYRPVQSTWTVHAPTFIWAGLPGT